MSMLARASARPAPIRVPARARRVAARAGQINADIKKDEAKVVNTVNVGKGGDIQKKAPYCRCWKSGTFPQCDGSHVKHNKDTGDNVGPLILDPSS